MRRIFAFSLLIILLSISLASGATVKLRDMTAITPAQITPDDLMYVVNDPSGTPVDRKVTIGDLSVSLGVMNESTPEYYGGASGGVVDNLAAIHSALAATGVCVFGDGIYRVSGSILPANNDALLALHRRKATILIDNSVNLPVIDIQSKTGVQIEGLVVDHGTQTAHAAIYAYASSYCSFIDLEVKNGFHGNIRFNGDPLYCTHNTISRCYIHGAIEYSGLNLHFSQFNTISQCVVRDNNDAKVGVDQGNGIGIFSSSSWNTVQSCLIENNGKCGIGVGGGEGHPPANPCYGNELIGNIVRYNYENNIDIHHAADDTSAIGNTCEASENGSGIAVIDSNRVSIIGNKCRYNFDHGIILQNERLISALANASNFCDVTANKCYMNQKHGIQLFGYTAYNTISLNHCIDNGTLAAGTYYGISLYSSGEAADKYGSVTDNIIKDNICYDTHVGDLRTQRQPFNEYGATTARNRFEGNIAHYRFVPMLALPAPASARCLELTNGIRFASVTGVTTILSITPPPGFAPGEVFRLTMASTAQITDTVAAPVAIATSLTSVGTLATADVGGAHGLTSGDGVVIAGATQTEYNGYFTILVTGANTFTYEFKGSATSPATGAPTFTIGNVALAGDFAGAAGRTISLVWNGTKWEELSRSAN